MASKPQRAYIAHYDYINPITKSTVVRTGTVFYESTKQYLERALGYNVFNPVTLLKPVTVR